MSGIIFTSLHRKVNDKDIKLEEQVKKYWNHWKKYDKSFLPYSIEGVSEKYLEIYDNFLNEK